MASPVKRLLPVSPMRIEKLNLKTVPPLTTIPSSSCLFSDTSNIPKWEMPIMEGFDPNTETLNMSHRQLGMEKILLLLRDLAADGVFRQADFAGNIQFEEVADVVRITEFIKKIKLLLKRNPTLISLGLASNHLFDFFPHPNNEHSRNYVSWFGEILLSTHVIHIDLSDNNIVGHGGRELKGLRLFLETYMRHGQSFLCRRNKLTSQGFRTLSHVLGIGSSLRYLDASENLATITNPWGKQDGLAGEIEQTSDGIVALSNAISASLHFRVLKLASNFLRDLEVEHIAAAISKCPTFQDLDISDNDCKQYGCRHLRDALLSHSADLGPDMGFRELNISSNPIGDEGVKEISHGVNSSLTLRYLRLNNCGITEKGAKLLLNALTQNSTVIELELSDNDIPKDLEKMMAAEIEANLFLKSIRESPINVDVSNIDIDVQKALARKLYCLDESILNKLHDNPSFNVSNSVIQESLYLLFPPSRHVMIEKTKITNKESSLAKRLEESRKVARRLRAADTIYDYVLMWYKRKIKRQKTFFMITREAMMLKLENERNS